MVLSADLIAVWRAEWSPLVTGKTRQRRSNSRGSDDAALHRRMRQQSLRTPWRNLADACEQMIEWRSFALWVRAIIGAERSLQQWLRKAIDQRCPGFLEGRSNTDDVDSLWLDLTTWIDEHLFTAARAGGWIEALHYYSGRDPRSEQIWQCWEHTEAAWRDQRPTRYPTADEWHQDAQKLQVPHDAECARSAPSDHRFPRLVAEYIEWEAFAFWVRLVVEREPAIPSRVAAVIEQRCPGFLGQLGSKNRGRVDCSTWLWRRLLAWIESHTLSDATRPSSLEAVRDAARTHLRGERITEYWADCSSRWRKDPPASIPRFEEWLRAADAYCAS